MKDNLSLISKYIKERTFAGAFPQRAVTIFSYLRFARIKHRDLDYWEREAEMFVKQYKLG